MRGYKIVMAGVRYSVYRVQVIQVRIYFNWRSGDCYTLNWLINFIELIGLFLASSFLSWQLRNNS